MRLAVAICGLSLFVVPAQSQIVITEDRGGQIGAYLQTYAAIRDSGQTVRIDGNCLSACTIILGIVPMKRVCVTQRARLGFHAAWVPDDTGRPVTSPLGTRELWKIYPPTIRSIIRKNGGLTRRMIYLEGRALARLIRPCEPAPFTITSDFAARPAYPDLRAQGN